VRRKRSIGLKYSCGNKPGHSISYMRRKVGHNWVSYQSVVSLYVQSVSVVHSCNLYKWKIAIIKLNIKLFWCLIIVFTFQLSSRFNHCHSTNTDVCPFLLSRNGFPLQFVCKLAAAYCESEDSDVISKHVAHGNLLFAVALWVVTSCNVVSFRWSRILWRNVSPTYSG
jgi:hypothetical protein